jgi:hypothetical protein
VLHSGTRLKIDLRFRQLPVEGFFDGDSNATMSPT